MKTKTYLTNVIEAADEKAQYDSEARKIVSDKGILAWAAGNGIFRKAYAEGKIDAVEG